MANTALAGHSAAVARIPLRWHDAWTRRVAFALITAGAAIRALRVIDRRSLWFDEAMLALNTCGRDLAGLATPLWWEQHAPIGYLWLERGACLLGNGNESMLRAPAYIAGLILPFLIWRITARFAGAVGQLTAVGLASVLPFLVRYSDEAKPYMTDALVAALLMLLVIRIWEGPSEPRRWHTLAIAGAMAIPLSTTAVLVLPSCVLALVIVPATRSAMLQPRRILALGLPWAVMAALTYLVVQHGNLNNPYAREFFGTAYLNPFVPGFATNAATAVQTVLSALFLGAFSPERLSPLVLALLRAVPVLVLSMMIASVIQLVRYREAPLVSLLVLPIALAGVASALLVYPIVGRTMLFAAPAIIVLFAMGMEWLARAGRPLLAVALLAFVTTPAVVRGAIELRAPIRRQHVRPLVEQFLRTAVPNAAIYVAATAIPGWVFYTTDWARPDTARLRWYARRGSYGGALFHSASYNAERANARPDTLTYHAGGRVEIAGIASGEFPRWGRPTMVAPLQAWANGESARIRRIGIEETWVLVMPSSIADESTLRVLTDAIRGAGGVLAQRWERREAYLFRYRFDSSATR